MMTYLSGNLFWAQVQETSTTNDNIYVPNSAGNIEFFNDCEVERLTCGDCISNREDHKCQEDDPETKNFECNFCDLRLPTTTHRVVVNHMKTSHPNQKLFHCNRCSFKCNWLYNLRSHKKLEHKIEAKKSDNLLATFSGIIGLFMKHTETQDSL